ncbi:hypothetical protein AYI68_g5111 [Smittium mucronatum]|uniref:Uncharacterized protein n=1 Tax=Smittium mucronatum TaxID=133383 RepID=A0A1R0GVC0_9FUNG|nr:hypothetical protein AYI68_g5111 [Smittium mucronatum]
MDFDANNNEVHALELAIVERQTEIMERSLILSSDSRIGDLYGFQRSGLGDRHGKERTGVQPVGLEQSVLLPALEPKISGDPEAAKRADKNDPIHPHVEIWAMVFGYEGIVHIVTPGNEINDGHSRTRKRKYPALYKQE